MKRRKNRIAESTPTDDDQPRRPSKSYMVLAVCGLLLLAVVLIFAATIRYDFVNFDDDVLVSENPIVARGVTVPGLCWAFTANVANMWYPLTWISYMLDSQMYGSDPWGYHLTNVLLHAATTVILFLVLRRMTGNLWASACAALLFTVHPLRAEAVAWVGERKSTLSGLFFVSTIAAYAAYARHPFSLARYLAVAGLLTLGLLAKPTLVTLPFLLLLLDYWPLRRWRAGNGEQGAGSSERAGHPGRGTCAAGRLAGRGSGSPDNACAATSPVRLVVEKVPLVALSIAASVAAVLSQGGNIAPLDEVPIPARIESSLVSYAVYFGQSFWPAGLAAYYPRAATLPAWQAAAAFLLLAALSLAALMLWRKQPAVLVGWLWYLGTLLPMVGLVQIGKHTRADRYTYLPQIGLWIAVVWGASWGIERLWSDWRPRRWLYGVSAALLAAGAMACAWQQVSYWQDSETLWTRTLACTSNNVVAETNLGHALASHGQFDEAIEHYRAALRIKPDNIQAYNDLGIALAGLGRFDEAIEQYQTALKIKPDYMQGHTDLGIALVGCGRFAEAIAEFRTALALDRYSVEARYNLGRALARSGQVDEAIGHLRTVVELKPDFAEAHNDLGLALAGRRQFDEAIKQYEAALEIVPDYVLAHNSLAGVLAERGKFDEAIDHLRKSLAIKPDNANTHVIFGDVLAESGRLDEALEHYREALDTAAARNDKALADAIRARIKLRQPSTSGKAKN